MLNDTPNRLDLIKEGQKTFSQRNVLSKFGLSNDKKNLFQALNKTQINEKPFKPMSDNTYLDTKLG